MNRKQIKKEIEALHEEIGIYDVDLSTLTLDELNEYYHSLKDN